MSFGLAAALIGVSVATLLLLVLVALIWFVFQRVLARTQGAFTVTGLHEAVEVVRDRWGVPHIYGANREDVFFGQGFVHAQDRLFQMEYGRRLASGTLAELFGAAALEPDRWSRTIGLCRAVARDQEGLDPTTKAALEAYTAGVNAYLDAGKGRLPAEFTLLGMKPAPWTMADTLGLMKVMAWALSQNWDAELLRVLLLQRLGEERALELEPLYPPGSHVIVPGEGQVDRAALAEAAGRLLAGYRALGGWLGSHDLAGSNNWVVSGGLATTRRPMLANDPHLSVTMPSLWYINHLEAADGSLRVTGANLAGVPGVMIGHNEHIAWGVTAGRADTQDLYLELPHPDRPSWFRYGDDWETAQVFEEEIHVRGRAEPHVEQVVVTRHGPIMNGLISVSPAAHDGEGTGAPGQVLPPLALRWSGYEPSTALRGLLRLQTASDWQSFRSALADAGEPSLNLVYADTAGNIGYQYLARVPLRRQGHGLVPVPGWDDSYEWTGFVPFDGLPSVLNPADGYALSANNKPVPDDYPYFLGADWYPGFRATRIERMLRMKPRFTRRDFQRMQMDVYSVQAESLVPFMIMIDGSDVFERRILQELEAWNLRVEVDSFAAAAYEIMRLHLLDLVFGDKLGPLADTFKGKAISDVFAASGFAGKAGLCLATLLENEESWWFGDPATGQSRTREELLRLALSRTAISLREFIGKDPRKWAWGKVHQISFDHLMGRVRGLGAILNRGQYPVAGDEHTVWMTAYELKLPFGLVTATAVYRQVLDVGDWDRSTAILSTGNSGQPGSPHYADQIDMWREGDQNPLLWSREAVNENAAARLWLRPAGGDSQELA